ncbi:Wzy polymerase domain-containing protein [Veronia pacifica]|uniref:Virulence factor membrane-bound polymerase C-terminal domain-containing protein n=1 Tax=Veronia pacifica TaxID=1080227 RepID=A0A1C3ELQ7_9GAMM|nr:Wzy polymerase domain-containing protein [Veronia pacifica]ODA34161.1 hypothetical protein A8L45_07730 [Veronia pacifica]
MLNTLQLRKATIVRKPLTKPLLLSVAAMFLFCLPLNEAELAVSGLHHPAFAFTIMVAVVAITSGLLEISRQHTFRYSPLTSWLVGALVMANLPLLYVHGDTSTSWQVLLNSTGCLLFFVALQQFSFSHSQRQLLLWLPLLGAGLLAVPLLAPSAVGKLSDTAVQLENSGWLNTHWFESLSPVLNLIPESIVMPQLAHHASSTVLLTSLPLSAYLMARTHAYKRTLTLLHFTLILIPMITVCALMAMRQPWLVTAALAAVMLVQPFLFRYARKIHQGLWNLSVLWGFWFSGLAGWLPDDALLAPILSQEQNQLFAQILLLIEAYPFQGTGDGMLTQSMLLFGLENGQVLTIPPLFPGWAIAWVATGGVSVLVAMIIVIVATGFRLISAPKGTRLILATIIAPSLIAMLTTSYSAANPALTLLLIIVMFWFDQLTGRYKKVKVAKTRPMVWFSATAMTACFMLVISSVLIAEQAVRPGALSDRALNIFRIHPWWQDYMVQEQERRQFINDVAEDNGKKIEHYLQFKLNHVARFPDAKGYQEIIDLTMMLGREQHALQLQKEAIMLFPAHHFEPKR